MSSTPIERLNEALSGHYVIEGELGEGGMATAYLADDLKHKLAAVGGTEVGTAPSEFVLAQDWIEELRERLGNEHPDTKKGGPRSGARPASPEPAVAYASSTKSVVMSMALYIDRYTGHLFACMSCTRCTVSRCSSPALRWYVTWMRFTTITPSSSFSTSPFT
jgi:hypothetical protein